MSIKEDLRPTSSDKPSLIPKDSAVMPSSSEPIALYDTDVQLPFHARPIREFSARLIEAWSKRAQVNPIEARDSLIPEAYTKTRYLTREGLEEVRRKVGDAAVVLFEDMDNVGILNDVGLGPVTDFLFKAKGKIFAKYFGQYFGQTGELCRYAGDEFLTILPNDPKLIKLIEAAQSDFEETRKQILVEGKLPSDLRDDLGSASVTYELRVQAAQKLAAIQKIMSAVRVNYRSDISEIDGSPSSESFGTWLNGKLSREIVNQWLLSQYQVTPKEGEVKFLTEAAFLTEQSVAVLAHSLQSYVANQLFKAVSEGSDPEGIDPGLVKLAERVYSSCQVIGTSRVMVALRTGYTPYDMGRSIATAEKAIYRSKLFGNDAQPTVIDVDPKIRTRESDQQELFMQQRKVDKYFEISACLEGPQIDPLERIKLNARAFQLICVDSGSDTVLRLSHIADFKAFQVLSIPDAAYYTLVQFKIQGYGAFNKGDGMRYADDVFSSIMETFANKFSGRELELRIKGGTGLIFLKGNQRLDPGFKAEIEEELSLQVYSKITEWTKLDFYERQAFHTAIANSTTDSLFFSKHEKRQDLGAVKVSVSRDVIHSNETISEVYGRLFPQ